MLLRSQASLLRERVNTFLGSLLLGTIALWAAITIWQAATDTNPLVKAFEKAYDQELLP